MEEQWIEFFINLPAAGADLVGQELADLGCCGVVVEEKVLDTFVVPDPDADLPEELTVRVFFPATDNPGRLRERIQERLGRLSALAGGPVVLLPDSVRVATRDWAEGWKQHFPPMRIGGRLLVKPSWESVAEGEEAAVVELDPGMAFGTGTHATTRMCLEALVERFEQPPSPRRVLDVGTGSGILAVAAAALGADRVLGCDIEQEACRAARENAGKNGVEERVEITAEPLEELEGGFEVVLANILAEENVRLAGQLTGRLAPGGWLILSGILQEKEGMVRDGFAPFGLEGPDVRRHEEWSCLVYRKRN